MKKRTKVLVPLLAGSMVVAACGGGSESKTTDAPKTTTGDSKTAEETMSKDTMSADTKSADTKSADTMSADTKSADAGTGEVAEPKTDDGVIADKHVIRVGVNGDLSGPFSSLVSEIVASQTVYWEEFNKKGGYKGWTVEMEVLDSGYATDKGLQNYADLAQPGEEGVLMITENTGSPITSALAPDAAKDNMLVIPLSWASLWPDPDYGRPILEKQTTYCNESVNAVSWLEGYVKEQGLEPKLAIVSRPGEYGADGAAGAKIAAEALGIPIVYDGTDAVSGDDRTAVISELVKSGATMVWTTLTPGELTDIFGNSVSQGMTAYWSGNSPSFDYKIHLASDYKDQFSQYYFHSSYTAPWATEGIPEMQVMVDAMKADNPDAPISDVYTIGWIEGMMTEAIIKQAIDDGDLTREHVYSIPASDGFTVDFGGLAAPQSWPDDYDKALVRSSWIYDVDATKQNLIKVGESTEANPGSSGLIPVEKDYVSPTAKDYQYGGPCITPSS